MRRIVSHLLALLAGLSLVAFLRPGGPALESSARELPSKRAPSVSATSEANPEAEAFSMAWRSLAELEMSRDLRRVAKAELLARWAKEEPLHFLRFFEKRALPDDWDEVAVEMLHTGHAKELLRFARVNGGMRLIGSLAERMDPRRSIGLLASEPGIPPEIFAEVASRGTAVDPDFARRVDELPAGPSRDFFLRGVMEVQMKGEDYRSAAETLGKLDENGPEMARELGEDLAHDGLPWPERAGLILSLPEKYRQEAYEGAMDWCAGEIERRTSEPAEIQDFLSSIVEGGIPATIPASIDLPEDQARDWGSWALGLPEGGAWEGLRESGVALWLAGDPGAPASLEDLPDGVVRDTALLALARRYRDSGDEEGVGNTLDQMSPAARMRWEE